MRQTRIGVTAAGHGEVRRVPVGLSASVAVLLRTTAALG